MYIPKKYGQSKTNKCPFCEKTAVTENKQGLPVCTNHKDSKLASPKCFCGTYLDLRNGKFGPYFNCIKCGNINFKKAIEMNPVKEEIEEHVKKNSYPQNTKINHETKTKNEVTNKYTPNKKQNRYERSTKKEITITSDELDFM